MIIFFYDAKLLIKFELILHFAVCNEKLLLNKLSTLLEKDIPRCISRALEEDINSGDITSKLIPEKLRSKAEIVTREFAILCGVSWVNEIFAQLDASVQLHWLAEDGDQIKPDQVFLKLEGSTKVLLTAERTILNFLQTLSGTATRAYQYAQIAKHSNIQILDTRKTIPGLRLAQKYAVSIGGCANHRLGLYDAFLIKENHIKACGGISMAIERARKIEPNCEIQIEVENLEEFRQAINAKADIILVDNFSTEDMKNISRIETYSTKIEASGNINLNNLANHLKSSLQINRISCGDLTKSVKAIDLSMRLLD